MRGLRGLRRKGRWDLHAPTTTRYLTQARKIKLIGYCFQKNKKSMLRASRPWADLSGLEGREENVLLRLLVLRLAL